MAMSVDPAQATQQGGDSVSRVSANVPRQEATRGRPPTPIQSARHPLRSPWQRTRMPCLGSVRATPTPKVRATLVRPKLRSLPSNHACHQDPIAAQRSRSHDSSGDRGDVCPRQLLEQLPAWLPSACADPGRVELPSHRCTSEPIDDVARHWQLRYRTPVALATPSRPRCARGLVRRHAHRLNGPWHYDAPVARRSRGATHHRKGGCRA